MSPTIIHIKYLAFQSILKFKMYKISIQINFLKHNPITELCVLKLVNKVPVMSTYNVEGERNLFHLFSFSSPLSHTHTHPHNHTHTHDTHDAHILCSVNYPYKLSHFQLELISLTNSEIRVS